MKNAYYFQIEMDSVDSINGLANLCLDEQLSKVQKFKQLNALIILSLYCTTCKKIMKYCRS